MQKNDWIRTNWHFDIPIVTFVISARALMLHKEDICKELMQALISEKPDVIASAATSLITSLKPELQGGFVVCGISHGHPYHGLTMQFTFCHRDLPTAPPGTTPDEVWLDIPDSPEIAMSDEEPQVMIYDIGKQE